MLLEMDANNELCETNIYSDAKEGSCMVVSRMDMDTGVSRMSFYPIEEDAIYEDFKWGEEVFSYDASTGVCEWDWDIVDDPRWDEMMGEDFYDAV